MSFLLGKINVLITILPTNHDFLNAFFLLEAEFQ